MKNISLKTRLEPSFATILIITIIIAVVGIVGLIDMNEKVERVIDIDVEKVKLGGQLGQDAQFIFRQRQNLIFAETSEEVSKIRQNIADCGFLMEEPRQNE